MRVSLKNCDANRAMGFLLVMILMCSTAEGRKDISFEDMEAKGSVNYEQRLKYALPAVIMCGFGCLFFCCKQLYEYCYREHQDEAPIRSVRL